MAQSNVSRQAEEAAIISVYSQRLANSCNNTLYNGAAMGRLGRLATWQVGRMVRRPGGPAGKMLHEGVEQWGPLAREGGIYWNKLYAGGPEFQVTPLLMGPVCLISLGWFEEAVRSWMLRSGACGISKKQFINPVISDRRCTLWTIRVYMGKGHVLKKYCCGLNPPLMALFIYGLVLFTN